MQESKQSEIIREYLFSWRKAIILCLLILLSVLCFKIGQYYACQEGALIAGVCHSTKVIATVNVCEARIGGGRACAEYLVNNGTALNNTFHDIDFN